MGELHLPAQPVAAEVSRPPNYIVAGGAERSVHVYLLGLLADVRRAGSQEDQEHADKDALRPGVGAKKLWSREDPIPEPIIAVEFVGPKFAVETTRRWLRAGKKVRVASESRRLEGAPMIELMQLDHGSTRYVPLLTPLPSGWVHALLLHPRATLSGIADGRDFYLVEPAEDPRHAAEIRRLTHFAAALDAALPFPVLPSWAAWLWEQGAGSGLITPLPIAVRLTGYRVSGDRSQWERILSSGVGSRALRADAPRAEGVAHGTA